MTAPHIGAVDAWLQSWEYPTSWSLAFGDTMACNRTVCHHMASDAPEFQAKAAGIIGLDLQPPLNAAVFCVDEKTAIQALGRLDPVLPLSSGRAESHGLSTFVMARSPCTPP
jgi:hypothetical protein